jgi:membrane-associated phospholipid phosphatase
VRNWFQNFAFTNSTCTAYSEVLAQTLKHITKQPRPASCAAVDFCKTYGGAVQAESSLTHSLKPLGFNHRTIKVISWFKVCFQIFQRVPLQYGMPSSHAQLAAFAAMLATLHINRRLGRFCTLPSRYVAVKTHSVDDSRCGPCNPSDIPPE